MKSKEELDANFWDDRYKENNTGWDVGYGSTPLLEYTSQVENKNIRILIPGCGNAHEVEGILKQGFQNITLIDISKTVCSQLSDQFKDKSVTVLSQDFFHHKGTYDLILEQTFFCALHPDLRNRYIEKMKSLLAQNGKLVGVLFNNHFEKEGPPFGGDKEEYSERFEKKMSIKCLESCYNSIPQRQGNEVFIIAQNKKKAI